MNELYAYTLPVYMQSYMTEDAIEANSDALVTAVTSNYYTKNEVDDLMCGTSDINSQTQLDTSHTITHKSKPEEAIARYQVGRPAFNSGKVYKPAHTNDEHEWLSETGPTDCICSVVTSGTYKTFVGVICDIVDESCIKFATHGDFYFNVVNTSEYKIGDTVMYDGSVVNDEIPMTNKVARSIVGVITSKINTTTLAVFKI